MVKIVFLLIFFIFSRFPSCTEASTVNVTKTTVTLNLSSNATSLSYETTLASNHMDTSIQDATEAYSSSNASTIPTLSPMTKVFNASVTTTPLTKSSHRSFLSQKLNLTFPTSTPSPRDDEMLRRKLHESGNHTFYIPPLFNHTLFLNLSLSNNTSNLQRLIKVLNLNQTVVLKKTHKFYEDKEQDSAVLVLWRSQDDFDDKILFGMVTYENSTYTLLPGSYADASEPWNVVLYSKMYHFNLLPNIRNTEPEKQVIEEVLSWDNTNDYLVVNGEMSKRTMYFREERRNLMEIELFIVVDYSLYLKWLEISNFNETEAKSNIQYYISHFVDEIDKKFSSIKYSSYKYRVKLVGYHITKDTRDCPYTEEDPLNGVRPLNAKRCLERFSEWLKENKRKFPGHDIALVLTDHELQSHQGLAYIRTACTDKSTAIITERGPKETVSTAVHEMGHLLGAFHDGWNNDCNSGDNHIMTSQHNAKQHATFNTFSSCSTSFFQQYINVLDKYDTNCFRRSSAPNIINRRLLVTPAGQRFDLETQCKLVYGVKSYYCSNGLASDESVCEKIFCYNPATSKCSRTPALQALDGTTCGSKKWCSKQQCSFHILAPSVAQTDCVQGDFTGLLHSEQGNIKCDQLSSMPFHCYDKNIRKLCCRTCSDLVETTHNNCEYGDKVGNCDALEKKEKAKMYCGMDHIRGACCETCGRIMRGVE